MKKEMLEMFALWEKTDRNGNTFFSGSLNGLDVLVFKNKYKEKPNQPDYKVYLAKKDKKEDSGNEPKFNNDDIPF